MQDNLVIVESPAKAKTIEKFLGKDYKVMSSYGHIRDLKKKEISIDLLTSGMRHPKYFLRSNSGLMARCSSVRKRVLVCFC